MNTYSKGFFVRRGKGKCFQEPFLSRRTWTSCGRKLVLRLLNFSVCSLSHNITQSSNEGKIWNAIIISCQKWYLAWRESGHIMKYDMQNTCMVQKVCGLNDFCSFFADRPGLPKEDWSDQGPVDKEGFHLPRPFLNINNIGDLKANPYKGKEKKENVYGENGHRGF